nr:hypothetical protein [Thiothrix subterranea]
MSGNSPQGEGFALGKEGFVFDFEHGNVHFMRDEFDLGLVALGRAVALDFNENVISHYVRIGENTVIRNDKAEAAGGETVSIPRRVAVL